MLSALVVTSFLTACCAKTEGRLVIGATGNPNEFAPMKAEKLYQASLYGMIYETLVLKKEDGSYDPWLASSWDISTNKLEWTFHIDPKAKYSNGTAVTAEDVKYAFDVGKRHASKDHFAQTKAAWAQIDTITVVDPATIKFTLKETFGTFLDSVCSVFIFPKSLWTSKEDLTDPKVLYNYNPATDAEKQAMLIGSGPMKFSTYVKDQWFWMVRNDNYWKGKVNVTEVVVNIYGSSELAITALKLSEVDTLMMLESPQEVSVLKKALDDNIELDILEDFNHSCMLFLNLRKAPFHLLNVRKAIDKAVDRADMITYSQAGYAKMPQNAPFAPDLPDSNPAIAWNKDGKTHATLVAEANALLDAIPGMTTLAVATASNSKVRKYDKGDGNGAQDMSYKCMYVETSPGYATGVDLIKGDLAEIGIKITADPVQSSTLGRTLFSGAFFWDFDTSLFGYGGGPEFEGLVRQWGNEPFAGNYDGSVIGWNNNPDNPPPGDPTKSKMTYYTPKGLDDGTDDATAAEKAHYLAVYNANVAASAAMQTACQASRRLAVGSAAYHTKALEIQQMFEDQLPVPIMYHGYFMTAYRTDKWTGWGNPEGTYAYGMCVPTMSLPTLLSLKLA
jgi:ABC-type transport system substrate-binding protein